MSVTITLHLWWLWVYLAIGTILWLPLNWLAWRNIAPPQPPFWRLVWRNPLTNLLTVVCWPIAVWESVR